MMRPMTSLADMQVYLREFARLRQWQVFHNPKNLAMALSVEVAELVEPFQWLTPEEAAALPSETLQAVADEIADVQLYLVRLADVLGVDIAQAVTAKAAKNEAKYPVHKVQGSAKKYTAYE